MAAEKKPRDRSRTFWRHRREWHTCLVDGGLFDRFPPQYWDDNALLVCLKESEDSHIFSLFANYLEFAEYQADNFGPNDRMFNEVIVGTKTQKPHFDIDVDLKEGPIDQQKKANDAVAEKTVRELVAALEVLLPEMCVERDLVLCSSQHPLKASIHVVIDNWMSLNAEESWELYTRCLERVSEPLRQYIDSAVYGKSQQFRMLGSHKPDKRNIKIVDFSILGLPNRYDDNAYFNEEHRYRLELQHSLVSSTGSCQLIPPFLGAGEKSKRGVNRGNVISLASFEHEDALMEKLTAWTETPGAFTVRGCFASEDGSVRVDLIREAGTYCALCSELRSKPHEVHENENPFVVVSGNQFVTFYCRRARTSSGQYLGQNVGFLLGAETATESPPPGIPQRSPRRISPEMRVKSPGKVASPLRLLTKESEHKTRERPNHRHAPRGSFGI